MGGGAGLLFLGAWPPQLCVYLGLRQLYQQTVLGRSCLSAKPGGGLPVHLRLLCRGLHQLHHPVSGVSLLPERPHRRQLCLLSGVQHPAHAAGAAGRAYHQGGADAAGEKPLLVLPHRHDLDGHLPVAAHERHAQPAGLVRPHLRLQHPAAHAGLPV